LSKCPEDRLEQGSSIQKFVLPTEMNDHVVLIVLYASRE
jgi:hypothetical protein